LAYAFGVRLAAALALAVVVAAPAARADNPVIHVRARLRIDLDAIERVPDGLVVRGSLRDDATDEPIVGRTVALSVEPEQFYHAMPTGPDGGFRWRVPLPLGSYRLRLAAGGDAEYLAPPPIDRNIDVGRRTPTLTVQVPARIAAHAPSMHVVVEGHESDGLGPPRAFDGDVFLTIGGRGRSALTLENGRAESDELGPFGRAGTRVEVRATVEEGSDRNGTSGTKSVLLTTPTTVTLAAGADRVAPDKLLLVTGLLSDDDGPIAGAFIVVGLENGADIASFTTDHDGRYQGWLRGRELPTGPAFLEARFRPQQDWRDAAVSPTVPVEVLPAPPIAVWPYVVSPALTLLAVALVYAARDRRWRRWLRVGRRARRIAAAPTAATPGLTESRRGILSSLRRADLGFSGIVVDSADDRAIPTATLVARTADGESRAATVDERGRFAFEDLAPGPLVVEAAAPGYVGERFSRVLPHRGELRNARIRLVPVRARIFDAWRRAAVPLYPTPRAAETMTPRELLRHVDRKRMVPNQPLTELTERVESAVWGAPAPSTEELAEVERLASALKANS
jgi:hypothetical protein